MAKNYDPKQVSIIVGGHIVEGYADGTFIKVARNNDMFSTKVGASGEGARAKSNDKSGTFEITLMQSSRSNSILAGFAIADENNNGGQVPVLMQDNNGDTIASCSNGWVKKMPDLEYGKELADRVWVIESDNVFLKPGGLN